MKPCDEHRDELIEAVLGGAGSVSPELAAHLARCAGCSAERARHALLGEELRGLTRQPVPASLAAWVADDLDGRSTERAVSSLGLLHRPAAPTELAGLVVSAMNAGHRQGRAAAWVVGLARCPAPGALDGLVQELPTRHPAPGVLDRLVAEELADPAKSMASRFLRRLERRAVPAGLEHRLAGARARAERGPAAELARRVHRIPRVQRLAVGASVLAATLLAWVGVVRLSSAPEAPPSELTLEFRVERARSIDDLGPIARSLVGMVADVNLLDLGEAR